MQRISAENWYRVRRLDDDVTAIDEPYIQEFYRCNIWHVRGRDRDDGDVEQVHERSDEDHRDESRGRGDGGCR